MVNVLPSERRKGRKIEPSQCREPITHGGVLLDQSAGAGIRGSLYKWQLFRPGTNTETDLGLNK